MAKLLCVGFGLVAVNHCMTTWYMAVNRLSTTFFTFFGGLPLVRG
jgi:hypothetical protein